MEPAEVLGNKIRIYRSKLNLSQAELAHRAGLSTTYLGEIERGTKGVSLESIVKIANALQKPIIELFENVPHEKTDYTLAMKSYEILIELAPEQLHVCYLMLKMIQEKNK